MKKKIAVVIVALCLMAAIIPTVSRAEISPHFIAVNDTLLPFNDNTMPYVSGGLILVPYNILSMAGVWSAVSENLDQVKLYRGNLQVDFFAARGVTQDRYGNSLDWPAAMRIGTGFYVPLHQVCEYFSLRYELIEVGRSVIPNRQIWVVRIISGAALSSSDFVTQYRNNMIAAYNDYYASLSSSSPGDTSQPPEEETPPNYSDITIYLSFSDITAGSADRVLDLLDAGATSGYPSCFFVSEDDIVKNPGLIRKISAGGHTVGICLAEGTYEEYVKVSALLFEAAKIKTVLVTVCPPETPAEENSDDDETPVDMVSDDNEEAPANELSDPAVEAAIATADEYGLVYCGISWNFGYEESNEEADVTENFPTNSGERWNLMFTCSESTASALPNVLTFLRVYDYSVSGIVETASPVW